MGKGVRDRKRSRTQRVLQREEVQRIFSRRVERKGPGGKTKRLKEVSIGFSNWEGGS